MLWHPIICLQKLASCDNKTSKFSARASFVPCGQKNQYHPRLMVQVRSCVRKQPKTEPLEPTVVALDEVIKRFDDHKQALSRDDIVSL
jgi:hypothetical protein